MLVAQETELKIAKAFESYRPNANRGSLIYFLMNQLFVIDHMYQYSLAAFQFIFNKALTLTLTLTLTLPLPLTLTLTLPLPLHP